MIIQSREFYQQMHGNRVYVEAETGAFLSNQKGYVFYLSLDSPLQSHTDIMNELLNLQDTPEIMDVTRDITNYATSNLRESMGRDRKLSEFTFRQCVYLSIELINQTHLCSSLFQHVLASESTSDELCEEIQRSVVQAVQITAALLFNSRIAKLSAVISSNWDSAMRAHFGSMLPVELKLPPAMQELFDRPRFMATSLKLAPSPTLKAAEQALLLFSHADETMKNLCKINIEENQEEIERKLAVMYTSLEAYQGFFAREMRMEYIRCLLEQNPVASDVATVVMDYLGEDKEEAAPPAPVLIPEAPVPVPPIATAPGPIPAPVLNSNCIIL